MAGKENLKGNSGAAVGVIRAVAADAVAAAATSDAWFPPENGKRETV